MYFEKLTDTDKHRIQYYIEQYANGGNAPLEKILKPWDEAKSGYLSTLFGDNMIISKEVEFEEGTHEIMDKIEELIYGDDRCQRFVQKIKDAYDIDWNLNYEYNHPARESYRATNALFDYITLAENAIKCDFNNFMIKDKPYKLQQGAKPLRVIAKIANAYGIGVTPDENGISDLEYFRRRHSQCLNNKVLKGDLCLSIHPLDYMTMSDNDCGWDSCMSWMNGGEYKQGTVEMMNSPCVVVGYLNASTPFKMCWGMELTDEERYWSNKKWRCLFIVDKDFIINIKQYPYYNDNLAKATIQELAKLAGWGETNPCIFDYYENYSEYRSRRNPCEIDGRKVAIEFHTGAMYNDFGANHYIALNPNHTDDVLVYDYLYSGTPECMNCGTTDEEVIGVENGESYLLCGNCESHAYCEYCDEKIPYDDYYTTAEGYKLCEWCWGEHTARDITTGEYYLTENLVHVCLNIKNGEYETYDYDFYVREGNIGNRGWKEYFRCEKPHEFEDRWGGTTYYVNPEDCMRDALWEMGLSLNEVEDYLGLEPSN